MTQSTYIAITRVRANGKLTLPGDKVLGLSEEQVADLKASEAIAEDVDGQVADDQAAAKKPSAKDKAK